MNTYIARLTYTTDTDTPHGTIALADTRLVLVIAIVGTLATVYNVQNGNIVGSPYDVPITALESV